MLGWETLKRHTAIMTTSTKRNNVKPMFTGISFVMVVFLCLFAAWTIQTVRLREFSGLYTIHDGVSGLHPVWISCFVSFTDSFCFRRFSKILLTAIMSNFVFVASLVSSSGGTAFFALVITITYNFAAIYTMILESVLCCAILIKFRNGLGLLALRASFCYDCLRHGFFSVKKLCSEPLQTQYLCGS